jgi:hypothetical protein
MRAWDENRKRGEKPWRAEPMNREMELQHLALAEKTIALGERHIQREEQMISELDRDGHDTSEALALLETYRRTQAQHVAHRNMLLKLLQQKDEPDAIFRPGHYDSSPRQREPMPVERAKDGGN